MNKLLSLPDKYGVWMALGWMTWHWGLLLFGFLPYPQPRIAVMSAALVIDGLCFVYFFVWTFWWIYHPRDHRTQR